MRGAAKGVERERRIEAIILDHSGLLRFQGRESWCRKTVMNGKITSAHLWTLFLQGRRRGGREIKRYEERLDG